MLTQVHLCETTLPQKLDQAIIAKLLACPISYHLAPHYHAFCRPIVDEGIMDVKPNIHFVIGCLSFILAYFPTPSLRTLPRRSYPRASLPSIAGAGDQTALSNPLYVAMP